MMGNTAPTDRGSVTVVSQNNKTNTKDISANGGGQHITFVTERRL